MRQVASRGGVQNTGGFVSRVFDRAEWEDRGGSLRRTGGDGGICFVFAN